MKDCIVLYESGIEFYSFGAVNCHDLGLYVEELAIGHFNIAFPLRSSLLLGCPSGKAKSKSGGCLLCAGKRQDGGQTRFSAPSPALLPIF